MKRNKTLLGVITALLPVVFFVGPAVLRAQEQVTPVPMELDETQWEAEMVYVTEKGQKETSTDTLVFKDKKFISTEFEDKGYSPTNYSLTAEEDGTTKFGTMQVKDKETSFWKGEVKENALTGSVHTQFPNGKTKTVYFTGKLVSGILKPKVEPKPVPPPPPTPPPVPTPAPTPPAPPSPPKVEPTSAVPVQPAVEKAVEKVQPPVPAAVPPPAVTAPQPPQPEKAKTVEKPAEKVVEEAQPAKKEKKFSGWGWFRKRGE